MELLIQLAFIAILLVIGLVVGGMVERRHFSSLAMREADLKLVMVFNEKTPPANVEYRDAFLVAGSVVLGEDYFKRFAASLRSFFGGNMRMYESLMDRGRREAILRMKEDARQRGARVIFNVRLETSSLGDGGNGRGMFSAEFIAYGTALVPAKG